MGLLLNTICAGEALFAYIICRYGLAQEVSAIRPIDLRAHTEALSASHHFYSHRRAHARCAHRSGSARSDSDRWPTLRAPRAFASARLTRYRTGTRARRKPRL